MQLVRTNALDKRDTAKASNDTVNVVARHLFASPVLLCEWPDTARLNADLRTAILKRFESMPSVVQSARNAWQSEHNMHEWPEPCVTEFANLLKVAAAKMAAHMVPDADQKILDDWRIVSCFANVTPPGGFSHSHDHVDTGALIAGVYYVDIGACEQPGHAGRTILQDHSGVARPKQRGGDLLAREYAVVPKPGAALLFTAAQMHRVEPYRGRGVRISIAFNLAHPDLDVLYYPGMKDRSWWWRNFRGLMVLREKIPEKMRALSIFFGSYLWDELGRQRSQAPLSRRLKSAYQRAQVDAQAASDPLNITGDHLPEKQQLD